MSFRGIPLQCEFMYREPWDEEMDKVFIDALIEQREAGYLNPTITGNYHALLTARGIVNGADITWEDIVAHFDDLHKCYDTFKYVIEHDKVWYDSSYNKVIAERPTWKKIFENYNFAKVYVIDGEPEWDKLKKLFKPTPTTPSATEVIVISDVTAPFENVNGAGKGHIMVSDADDEVVSPLYNVRQGARKKLFEEIYPTKFKLFDIDETKTIGSQTSPIADGLKFPPPSAFPPKPKTFTGCPSKKSGSSSCASSSPVKWFYFDSEKN